MNDDVQSDEVFEIEQAETGGVFAHLPWWLILTVAVIVTELTAHPSVGVIVLCLKFGWNDFRTALWLRRRDPNRIRGAVSSWFYMSSGLWRVCLWSFGLMFGAIIFLVAWEGPRPAGRPKGDPELPPEVMACMGMWIASFAVATCLTAIAVCLAWPQRVRVWISRSVADSGRMNLWPPRTPRLVSSERNLLKWWMIGMGAGVFVFLFILGVLMLLATWDAFKRGVPAGKNPGGGAVIFGALVGAGLPFGAAVMILWVGGKILARIEATSPSECWPDDESILRPDSFD